MIGISIIMYFTSFRFLTSLWNLQSHELSQANGNRGCSVNTLNSSAARQLVTVPIGLCLPPTDGSEISAGMWDFTLLLKSINCSKHPIPVLFVHIITCTSLCLNIFLSCGCDIYEAFFFFFAKSYCIYDNRFY
jgi:hypothetical protein